MLNSSDHYSHYKYIDKILETLKNRVGSLPHTKLSYSLNMFITTNGYSTGNFILNIVNNLQPTLTNLLNMNIILRCWNEFLDERGGLS